MISTFNKIKENGGSPLSEESSLKQLRKTKLYVVLSDSERNMEYLEETFKVVGGN